MLLASIRRLSLLPLITLVAWVAPVGAVTVGDLYETEQPVETSRDAAFVDALKAVIVRVSGQRDAPARLGAELNSPQRFVQRYGFTNDNVLQVGFDSVSIDRLLQGAGLPIWGRERPATLVLLSVEEADGSSHWISGEQPAAQREILGKVARQRGLPLKWPAVDPQGIAQGDDSNTAALLQEADRYGANATLIGRARGTSVRWTLISSDGAANVAGGLDDGVHLAADTFARYVAASGSSVGSVMVEVSGIGDLDAYAATLNYLEGMTMVRSVAVERVAGDTLRFKLAVRGDAATLRRAIALDNKLVPTGAGPTDSGAAGTPEAAGEHLAFRYRP
jgi:hypothetical protein